MSQLDFLETCSIPFVVVGADHRILRVSLSAAEIVDCQVGNYIHSIVHPEDMEDLNKSFLGTNKPFRCAHGDSYKWVRLRAIDLLDDPTIRGIVCIWEDYSNTKFLETKNAKKDEFIAVVAHELRNPLGCIRNAARLLSIPDAGPHEPFLEVIDRQSKMLVSLINDLMDVASISEGKVSIRKERLRVSDIMQTSVEATQPEFDQRKHSLSVRYPDQDTFIDGDFVRLQQVFTNLLANAAKYTEDGGEVLFEATRDGSEIVFRVVDNGIGIAPDKVSKIFEMFYQERTKRGSLGIGLALVRNLVELHGGSIKVESAGLCKGSVFTVRLPLLSPIESPNSLRILIIEDSPDSAETLARILAHQGHDVEVASDGAQAIAKHDASFDVVLCDIGLPDINGYDLAGRLRRDGAARLVAISGYDSADRPTTMVFDHHLPKPIEPRALEEYLTRV